jgi:response regulator RpfG family c-di-GMP phosphodiesterase
MYRLGCLGKPGWDPLAYGQRSEVPCSRSHISIQVIKKQCFFRSETVSGKLLFKSKSKSATQASRLPPWRVLIVDDEAAIHEVTQIVIQGFEFDGRRVEFLHAYSAKEARVLLAETEDIAIALLDVVMETSDAGLELARWIREELGNHKIRLVLRTGQPGEAPEEKVIRDFDINDYKEKTELTHSKLVTLFYAGLRGYRDLMKIERAKQGLRRAIHAISSIYDVSNLREFASAVLEQLNGLLSVNGDGICINQSETYTACSTDGRLKILAATEAYSDTCQDSNLAALPPKVQAAFTQALTEKTHHLGDNEMTSYYRSKAGSETLVYMSFSKKIDPEAIELLEIFTANVAVTYESLLLRQEVEETQQSTIYILGEAVEQRSKETGAHVKRVGEISALLGKHYGLPERDINDLRQAAPLHDVGKVGIPDAILNKQGRLTPQEWEIMQRHAYLGYELLRTSDKRILQLAAVIAHQHHEKWDGSGYPQGLAAEDIHIAGRISALADVVDALMSKRCYKEAWSLDAALDYVHDQRGRHFEPKLVDILFEQLVELKDIYRRFPDTHLPV